MRSRRWRGWPRFGCSSSGVGFCPFGVGFCPSQQPCEEEPGQQSEDDRSARAEVRELILNVSVITYEVTSQPSAQAGGFATAHQTAPAIPDLASARACNTPTPSPV